MLGERHTGERGTVRNNSGLPVHQSGPGLGRANSSINGQPKTGGLPTNPFSQPKTGQGLGQSPSGGEAAVPSSLDPIKSNRNKHPNRHRSCGCFTLVGQSLKTDETLYQRLNCKTWTCKDCGRKKGKTIQACDSFGGRRAAASEIHYADSRPGSNRRRPDSAPSRKLQQAAYLPTPKIRSRS
jgi:hypothetical protein